MNPGLASIALSFATTVGVVLAATLEAGGLDDAYITYVFARRLADGEGFTWLPGGPRVYGTSTLPYALLLAATRALGAEMPPASMVIGALAWGVASALLFLLVRRRAGTAAGLLAAGLSALSLRAVNVALGMETGLAAALALSAFELYARGRERAAGLAAAALVMTRLDGALVGAMLALHLLLTGEGSLRARAWYLFRTAAPAMVVCATFSGVLVAYFGTAVPQSLVAKWAFGPEVSGRFAPHYFARLFGFATPLELAATVLLAISSGVGVLATARALRERASLAFVWPVAHAALFTAARVPDSPWYYAVVVPAVYGAFALGTHALTRRCAPSTPWSATLRLGALGAAGLVLVATAWGSAGQIVRDPLGRRLAETDERRILAAAIVADLERRGARRTSVLAYEVGVLGWTVPGAVHDLLGLVSPEALAPGGRRDPLAFLASHRPEYVVIIDLADYPPTGPIQRSPAFHETYRPIFSLPRIYLHNYVVYRRVALDPPGPSP